eukprot:11199989-Lingulodinium_polyedra.AAC.1
MKPPRRGIACCEGGQSCGGGPCRAGLPFHGGGHSCPRSREEVGWFKSRGGVGCSGGRTRCGPNAAW